MTNVESNVHVKVAMADVLAILVISMFTFAVAIFGLNYSNNGDSIKLVVAMGQFVGIATLLAAVFAYMNENLLGTAIFGPLAVFFFTIPLVGGLSGAVLCMVIGIIILIDAMSNTEEVERFIIPGLRKVGLDPAQIKVLIIEHGHGDHYGGSQDLIEKYHPKVYMSEADWTSSISDYAGKLAINPQHFGPPPAKRDQTATDGGTITLGDETIRTYITPGHTPGSLAFLIPVKDHGSPKLLAYYGGITPPWQPEMVAAFTRSYERMSALMAEAKPDGFIASHPNYDDAVFNIEKMMTNPNIPNPFLIGTDGVVRYGKIISECGLNSADLRAKVPGWPRRR